MNTRLALLALGSAAALIGSSLPGQPVVVTGVRTASATVTASLVIPPRLHLRTTSAPTFVEQRGDTTTWMMTVDVAANLEWTLRVTAVNESASRDEVRVQDHAGTWRSLTPDGVTVATEQPPANWHSTSIGIQVIGAVGRRAPNSITCDLEASGR